MKIKVDFEFEFGGKDKSHGMVIDLSDSRYASLAGDLRGMRDVEEFEETLDHWLQYELIMPLTKLENIVLHPDSIEYDLVLDLDGTAFRERDKFDFDWHEGPPSAGESLEEYIEDYYSGTHHNFDIYDVSVKTLAG